MNNIKAKRETLLEIILSCDNIKFEVQKRLWALQQLCQHPNRQPSRYPMHYRWECPDCNYMEMDVPCRNA